MNNPMPRQAGMAKRTAIVMVAVVVVALVIVLSGWLFFSRQNSPRMTLAPQGELISGFPKALILDNAAAIDNSYTVGYSPNLNQYTASWISSSTMDGLYARYLQYFAANSWTITNSSTNITAFRGIYAVTSSADANVTMDDSGTGGLKVTVSYVKK